MKTCRISRNIRVTGRNTVYTSFKNYLQLQFTVLLTFVRTFTESVPLTLFFRLGPFLNFVHYFCFSSVTLVSSCSHVSLFQSNGNQRFLSPSSLYTVYIVFLVSSLSHSLLRKLTINPSVPLKNLFSKFLIIHPSSSVYSF